MYRVHCNCRAKETQNTSKSLLPKMLSEQWIRSGMRNFTRIPSGITFECA